MPYADVFVTNFDHLPVTELIVTVRSLADKAETHVAFQGQLPEYVTPAAGLRQFADELERGRAAAANRDIERTAELKALVAAVKQALARNALHIAMLAMHRNDPSILRNSGYPQKDKSTKQKAKLLDLVPEVFAKHGTVSGMAIIMVKRANPHATVELQMTDQDPNKEESWAAYPSGIHTKSRIEQKDLEPAKRFYFRARYHQDGGTGRWSAAVPLIIL